MRVRATDILGMIAAALVAAAHAHAQCPAAVPVQGAPLRGAAPLFPADHWWNADVSAAPVDPQSAAYIAFIGASRRLHPDFGGTAAPGSTEIYGMPYAVVDGTQPKVAVTFDYADESDGAGVPFYPLPAQSIGQAHWVEGGAPAAVDQGGARS